MSAPDARTDRSLTLGEFVRLCAPFVTLRPSATKKASRAVLGDEVVGVAYRTAPGGVSDDGATLEVTRLCTDGTKNACSFLYGAAARATFALGYRRLGTYILKHRTTSLAAAGWKLIGQVNEPFMVMPVEGENRQAPDRAQVAF
jgi:hypothetical protein